MIHKTAVESDFIEDGYYGRCDTCDWDGPRRERMEDAYADIRKHKEEHEGWDART